MRIAYVITRGDTVGGASIHVRDLARAMRQRGHDVQVLIGGTGEVTDQLTAAGVPFRAVPSLIRAIRPWRDVAAVAEVRAALAEFQPDLVSAHTAKAGFVGRAAAASLQLPCIYTPHGLAVSHRISPAQGRIFTLAERIAARWCQAIVCVSEAERQLALEKRIAPPEKMHVVHNGVGDTHARAQPGLQPPQIVTIARFEPPKDFETLFAALDSVRNEPWRKLTIVGGGSEGAVLPDRVEAVGYLADPALVLTDAQIFVLSSRSEGFPRSILEAMRAGLPVVATDVGGVREAVEHERTGLLVPPGDISALAAALRSLMNSPSERERLGAAGRLAYAGRFSVEAFVFNTLRLYATIVGVPASNW